MGDGEVDEGGGGVLIHVDEEGKEYGGNAVDVDREDHRQTEQRDKIGEEDVIDGQGQDGQVGEVAAVGEEPVPAQHHDQRSDGHGEDHKEVFVRSRGADGIEVRLTAKILQQRGVLVEHEQRGEGAGCGQHPEYDAQTHAHLAGLVAREHAAREVAGENPERPPRQVQIPAFDEINEFHRLSTASTISPAACSASVSWTREEKVSSSEAMDWKRLRSSTEP